MANHKNIFAGLLQYKGNDYSKFTEACTSGRLVFAQITEGEHKGNYLYANGITYDIADASNFKNLVKRVEDVSQGVLDVSALVSDLSIRMNASVGILDTSVTNLELWQVKVDTSINTLNSSVLGLETWKTGVNSSLNSFDTSIKNHESRIGSLESNGASDLKNASISSVSENNTATVTLTTTDASNNQLSTSVSLSGDDYVKVGGNANNIELSIIAATTKEQINHASIQDSSLATANAIREYVEEKIQALEGALEFKGDVASAEALTTILTNGSKGDVYVATAGFNYGTAPDVKKIEAGDLVILTTDASTGTPSAFTVVERNLDGAVTSGDTLTDDYIILGSGNQSIKVSQLTYDALVAAIANANSAVQSITTDSSTTTFIEAYATNDGSIYNVQIGAKTATLTDASNGTNGLATASDVYTELTKVEETIAAAETAMATTLGLEDNFDVSWGNSGIVDGTTYKQAIINAYGAATAPSVISFGGAVGAISVQGSQTNGEINLHMNSSTLVAEVVGLDEVIAEAINTSINALDVTDASVSGKVVIAVPEVDGKVAPERVQLKINGQNFATADGSMGVVINGSQILVGGENATHKDSSIAKAISDLSTAIDNISVDAIKSVVGETSISGDGIYVAVTATESPAGTVTLASELTLAPNTYGSTSATGLATDAYVKDFLAWEVITDD